MTPRHATTRTWMHVGWLGLVLTASGCCGDGIEYFPVTGQVTLDGKPLPDAVVSFMPDDEGGVASLGETDAKGVYALRQTADLNGAPVGKYTVRVTTYREGKPDADSPFPGVPEKVPARYNVRTTLSAEVEPKENSIGFELSSKGEIIQPPSDTL
ncbi:carboxypeptidase regulatory-like domain-containing protein [Planctomycetota bacterium]